MHIISTLQHNKLFSDCILLSLLTIILNQTYIQKCFLLSDRQTGEWIYGSENIISLDFHQVCIH
jgi:hypothetical protein